MKNPQRYDAKNIWVKLGRAKKGESMNMEPKTATYEELWNKYKKMREEAEFQKDQFGSWWTFIHGLEENEELTEEEISLRTWLVLSTELKEATSKGECRIELELSISENKANAYKMYFYPIVEIDYDDTITLCEKFLNHETRIELDAEDFCSIELDVGIFVDFGFVLWGKTTSLTITWEGFPKWTGKPSIHGVKYIGE